VEDETMTNPNHFTSQEIAWYKDRLTLFGEPAKTKSDTDADVLCPVHGDRNPSLGVDLRRNGSGPKILINCRSQGCEYEEILEALGIESSDLTYEPNGKPSGCTLDMYAASKRLPLDFLTSDEVGLQDWEWRGVEAIEIPYMDEEGRVVLSRYRINLKATKGSPAIVSRKGDKAMLYGLHWLEDAREAGYAMLCEGESDCHSAWYRNIPALGVPGVGNWKKEWASYLEGLERILVLVEPDRGETLWRDLNDTRALRGRLGRIDP
jgi:putative DNA primase/helicase